MLAGSFPYSVMLNLYDAGRANPSCGKLVIGEFLFAEYTCGVSDKLLPNWTEQDYCGHIVTGKKAWHLSAASGRRTRARRCSSRREQPSTLDSQVGIVRLETGRCTRFPCQWVVGAGMRGNGFILILIP